MGLLIKFSKNKEQELETYIDLIVDYIFQGKLIAFPTNSVYGIGGDPFNVDLINRIYDIKYRDPNKGFLLLVSDLEEATKIAIFNDNARRIAKKFWPGQLTIILEKNKGTSLPAELNAFQETIGLRVPENETILRILQELKKRGKLGAIIGTSANFSGEPPSISGTEVSKAFMGAIDLIIDSGKTKSKIPTTIVDLSTSSVKILRAGKISEEEIRKALD
ncbi:MAG: threonylcarbamoyl-AMP synthase [Candidatus Lokiarchaeota archaeon]|nr:threonylcarbamoyl-AMP synthase [Candidatus Lokiarchaeota archaeon]